VEQAEGCCNLRKHCVAFDSARHFEFETAIIRSVDFDDGEERIVALGFIGAKLHVLVYTERGDVVWIISLRHAEKHEWRSFYGQL
jgi:uncharacterized DUF497 family protein